MAGFGSYTIVQAAVVLSAKDNDPSPLTINPGNAYRAGLGEGILEYMPKKLAEKLLFCLEILICAGILALSFGLCLRYLRQGEESAATVSRTDEKDRNRDAAKDISGDPELFCVLPQEQTVRVRICGDRYEGDLFPEVSVTSKQPFTVSVTGGAGSADTAGTKQTVSLAGGETYTASFAELQGTETAVRIQAEEGGTLTIAGLERDGGTPQYPGSLWIRPQQEGLAVVNETELEEYLYSVVASEMPSDYPPEALKAQAVCARTYAVNCMRREQALADLTDSVNDQVYQNYAGTEQSRRAVDETKGEILQLETVQYYSTSCLTEHREDLSGEEAFERFLQDAPPKDAEYGSPWLRWRVQLSAKEILKRLDKDYGIQAECLEELVVADRSGNGQAQTLRIRAGGEVLEIQGEYEIRRMLSPTQETIRLADGTELSGMALLPSAFFYIEEGTAASEQTEAGQTREAATLEEAGQTREAAALAGAGKEETEPAKEDEAAEDTAQENRTVIRLYGGGYGHGRGMSQCGAARMAEEGADYREILEYYYREER